MKRPNLFEGVLVAFVLTAVGFALSSLSGAFYWAGWQASGTPGFTIAAVTFAYLLYLLSRCAGKTGKLTIGALALATLSFAALIGLAWPLMLILGVGLIWLVRSLYAYSSLVGALGDGLLCVLSIGWAAGTWSLTGSVLWSLWCFFLAQAAFTLIPAKGLGSRPKAGAREEDVFGKAQMAAESALRQLAARQ